MLTRSDGKKKKKKKKTNISGGTAYVNANATPKRTPERAARGMFEPGVGTAEKQQYTSCPARTPPARYRATWGDLGSTGGLVT